MVIKSFKTYLIKEVINKSSVINSNLLEIKIEYKINHAKKTQISGCIASKSKKELLKKLYIEKQLFIYIRKKVTKQKAF